MSDTSVVYLDHAAATPLDQRVFLAMQPFFETQFYNPSASYRGGREARAALEAARAEIGGVLGAKPNDIVFTAGATESINLAVHGTLQGGGHAVLGALEHASVRSAVSGYPHTIAGCDERGIVSVEAIRAVLRDDTTLVSVAYADSEFGVVQSLSDIAHMLDDVRSARRRSGSTTPLYFHTDASQAAIALDLQVARLGVDMMTLNAAKCYGPKQVGVLWLQSSVQLASMFAGGGQERGLRGGTENVAGAVGFATALTLAQRARHSENIRLEAIKTILRDGLVGGVEGLVVDGHKKRSLPGLLHVHLPGLDAERVVFRLDMEDIFVATGAACAASKQQRVPALSAIGLTPEEADGSLRMSAGKCTTLEQVQAAVPRIVAAIQKERLL